MGEKYGPMTSIFALVYGKPQSGKIKLLSTLRLWLEVQYV